MDLAQEGHKVLQGPPQPIDRPGGDHVELTPGCFLQHAVEGWALVPPLGTADGVIAVLLDDLPASALGYRQQLAALTLDALSIGRDAGVDRYALGLGAWPGGTPRLTPAIPGHQAASHANEPGAINAKVLKPGRRKLGVPHRVAD